MIKTLVRPISARICLPLMDRMRLGSLMPNLARRDFRCGNSSKTSFRTSDASKGSPKTFNTYRYID